MFTQLAKKVKKEFAGEMRAEKINVASKNGKQRAADLKIDVSGGVPIIFLKQKGKAGKLLLYEGQRDAATVWQWITANIKKPTKSDRVLRSAHRVPRSAKNTKKTVRVRGILKKSTQKNRKKKQKTKKRVQFAI